MGSPKQGTAAVPPRLEACHGAWAASLLLSAQARLPYPFFFWKKRAWFLTRFFDTQNRLLQEDICVGVVGYSAKR